MSVFDDLLTRLAAEYSALSAENRALKNRISCDKCRESFTVEIETHSQLSTFTGPRHAVGVKGQFLDRPMIHVAPVTPCSPSLPDWVEFAIESGVEANEKWSNIVQLLLVCAEPSELNLLDVWATAHTSKLPNSRLLSILHSLEEEHDKVQKKKGWLLLSTSSMLAVRTMSITLDPNQFVLRPNAKLLVLWSILVTLFMAYDVMLTPIEYAFEFSFGSAARTVRFITAIFWTLDIVVSFFSGYYDENAVAVLRARVVAGRYLRSWFVFDVILVALDWLAIALDLMFEPFYQGASELSPVSPGHRALRGFRLFRLLRTLRVFRVESQLAMVLRRALATNSQGATLVAWMMKALLQSIVAIHFFTCAWYALGAEMEDGWVSTLEYDRVSVAEAYFISAEWVVSHIHGTNRIFPQNAVESIIQCVATLSGFSFFLWFTARLTNTMRFMWDERFLQMRAISMRYLRSHKISEELASRVQLCLNQVHETTALHEHQEQEAAWLSLLPKQVQIDLHEEARAKLIVSIPFFHALSLNCNVGVRILCYEAISSRIAVWPDKVFCAGYTATEVFFVESGKLSYMIESDDDIFGREWSKPSTACSSFKLASLRFVAPVQKSKRCISEPALWTTWTHVGDLSSTVNSRLLALNVESFSKVMVHFRVVLPLIVDFARRYVYSLNKLNGNSNDLVNLRIPFVRPPESFKNQSEDAHFIFLSHYKIEAGTEAALMRAELCRQIRNNPFHAAYDLATPVFLDSEDLENLKEIGEHVCKSKNLLVLLTPNVLRRPWCLIELTLARRENINIVPVGIERIGMKFEYPTAAFYEELRTGRCFAPSDLELFRGLDMQLSEIEDAVQEIFQTITVAFSPHRPKQIRALELRTILKRCGVEEHRVSLRGRIDST